MANKTLSDVVGKCFPKTGGNVTGKVMTWEGKTLVRTINGKPASSAGDISVEGATQQSILDGADKALAGGTPISSGDPTLAEIKSELASIRADMDTAKAKTYITKTWHKGTNWYRVWSDGFIEQGGILPKSSASLTFPHKFSNTNYTLVGTIEEERNGLTDHFIYNHSDKTATSIAILQGQYNEGVKALKTPASWYACGY